MTTPHATHRLSRSTRDAGLRKVGAITRWSLAGALAGTGFFAGLASLSGHAVSGSKVRAGTTGSVASGQSSDATSANGADDGTNQFSPAVAPTVVPAQTGGFGPIVSGAS